MFAKKYRITKKEDFDLIFRKGRSFYADFFMVKILRNDLGFSRFSVLVSKKVSLKAVERNAVKRKLREILKKNSLIFPPNSDIIVYANKSILNKSFSEIEKILLKCFGK
jgi:ribonuclease P protein component